jgi:hypothetical protein
MDSKKTENIENKDLETLDEATEDEVIIEKPKTKRQGKNTGENWVMTPKRAEALKKAQIKLKEKNDKRKEEKMIKEEEERKILEQKVIAKAIALKKRQLKKEQVIDDIPVEVPLRPKPKPTVETYVPKYRFL